MQVPFKGNKSTLNHDVADDMGLPVASVANKATVISQTTAVSIGGGQANDTVLQGIVCAVALTGSCVITGFGDDEGTAKNITLPAATPAGYKDFGGIINDVAGITVTCSNAADDGDVIVVWRPA